MMGIKLQRQKMKSKNCQLQLLFEDNELSRIFVRLNVRLSSFYASFAKMAHLLVRQKMSCLTNKGQLYRTDYQRTKRLEPRQKMDQAAKKGFQFRM
jgi:hypothetical protein